MTAPIPLEAVYRELLSLAGERTRMRFLVIEESARPSSFDALPATLLGSAADAPPVRTARYVVYPFEMHAKRVTLGRNPAKSDIVVRDARISGAHAAIAPGPGSSSWLVDLASSNGTFIESRCLAPGEAGRAELRPGMTFSLGRVAIRFLDEPLLRSLASATQQPAAL